MALQRMVLVLVAVFCCSVGDLYAQDADAELSVVQQVEAHNAKGLMHYEMKEFPEAISEMLLAYHLIPEPGLLYNVARIYHKMDERMLAQQFYRKFVGHEDANPENVKQALVYIQEIDKIKKAQEAAQKLKDEAAAKAEAERVEKEKQIAAVAPQPEIKTTTKKTCLPCWLSMGMATGTLGVGATTGYLALTQKEAFETSFNQTLRAKAAQDGQQYALLSDISWVSAGVLSTVAGVLFYRHATQQNTEETKGPE
jgi:tetratricopeptide (TPR) repeat protein